MSGAAGGAAAAAAAAAKMAEEEETLARYSGQELADGWEFKILRSATGAFRNPEKLAQTLAEEGQAGWIFVEKFDNGRLRFKRRAGSQLATPGLGFDPYRSHVGLSEVKLLLVVLGAMIGLPFLILILAMLITALF